MQLDFNLLSCCLLFVPTAHLFFVGFFPSFSACFGLNIFIILLKYKIIFIIPLIIIIGYLLMIIIIINSFISLALPLFLFLLPAILCCILSFFLVSI